jgi:catechol 2,3-dioxygenase-like lactoylglutathione lyase family enzyme
VNEPEAPKLGWVIVYVPDVREAIAFYGRVFGLAATFVDDGGDFGQLDTGSTALAFVSETLADSNFEGGFQRTGLGSPPVNIELALVFDDVGCSAQGTDPGVGPREAFSVGSTELAQCAGRPVRADLCGQTCADRLCGQSGWAVGGQTKGRHEGVEGVNRLPWNRPGV